MEPYQPKTTLKQPEFLPMSRQEMDSLGWKELDILLISGDAYLDHPAQGPALLGRWLVAHGFRVGLVAQPRWRHPLEAQEDITTMGRPRLMAAVSAGSMDSMLAHYTSFRKKRSNDALTPGGASGARPNRATLVYTGLVRAAFPGLLVLIGGLEASLRRFSHYDFWQDKLRPSFLLESKADYLVYGPGEKPLLAAANHLKDGDTDLSKLSGIASPQSATWDKPGEAEKLASHEDILADHRNLMEATLDAEKILHQRQKATFQACGGRGVLANPPAAAFTEAELDFIYQLPFTRKAHPSYTKPIPAWELLSTSITTHRGCAGGCSFCSLALHQGRRISSRSKASIMAEARHLARKKPVALSDVGAATANLWGASCTHPNSQKCARRSCLWPQICPNLKADQSKWLSLLDQVAAQPGIKQVRVASGVRYDLALTNTQSFSRFLSHFAGGQLKVAPEHLDPEILNLMRKPSPDIFIKFLNLFEKISGPGRYMIPYLISAFPGSSQKKMKELSQWLASRHWRPRQVQAFVPTPGTVATAMYYAQIDENGHPLSVPTSDRDRLQQHALLAPRT